MDVFLNPAESNRATALSPLLSLTTTHPPTHTEKQKNTGTMIATIRQPLAGPILEVSAIAVRCTIDYDDSDVAM